MKIEMKNVVVLLLASAFMLSAAKVSAEPKPRWVQKGVKSLDRARSNDSYSFRAFTTKDPNYDMLENGRLRPLMEYVGAQYGAAPESIRIDSLVCDGSGRTTYRLQFESQGEVSEVLAQRVDDWTRFESYPDNSYDFQLSQLYAVSERNAEPQFDDFSITRSYGIKPMFMSLIPGLGQIYKGQAGKGYAIMGTEAVFIAGAIYSASEMAHYKRLANKNPDTADSYQSSVATFRQLRNVCLIAGGALYLYNLIDAAVAKGANRVVVKRANGTQADLAFTPVVEPCATGVSTGVGVTLRF